MTTVLNSHLSSGFGCVLDYRLVYKGVSMSIIKLKMEMLAIELFGLPLLIPGTLPSCVISASFL